MKDSTRVLLIEDNAVDAEWVKRALRGMEEELALDAVRHGAQDYLFKDKLRGELLIRVIHFSISLKRMELRLKNMTLELKRSNDDLMQFARTVAHDLKPPWGRIWVHSNLGKGATFHFALSSAGRKIESFLNRSKLA